jgi:23S rRNA (adenine2503-C2)-methyltransferase
LSSDIISISSEEKINLIGLDYDQLANFFSSIGEKSYRANQLMSWLYHKETYHIDLMTDMSLKLRNRLKKNSVIELPQIKSMIKSKDGTIKWIIDVRSGQFIETVFIPELNRGTLCISSQVGCALDCSFCSTGHQGFNRNLLPFEILGQVLLASKSISNSQKITNIVFMGMGEPLANYKNLLPVIKILIDDKAFGLSRRKVTVSTSGIVPIIKKLSKDCNVALAVSLHAPRNSLRDKIVPINKIHPIEDLLEACWLYAESLASRQITFEYVMLDGVNDSKKEANDLIRLLRGMPAKVNLIPFNSFSGTSFKCSKKKVINLFHEELKESGIFSTIRKTRGDDIDAACGQLAGQVNDLISRRLSEKSMRSARY